MDTSQRGYFMTAPFALFLILCGAMSALAGEEMHMHHQDSMVKPLNLPMSRDGSGTSWQPDQSPMSMILVDAAGFHFMFHGSAFLVSDIQGGKRGDKALNSINWFMAMASHRLWVGQVSARAMLSLEPLTMRGDGYPLLLQSGETWQGQPLHDRQHPHDLFMELALKYTFPIHDHVGMEFYLAPAGEPALGPVAFPHRVSARTNPQAPLGHHWYDSTHITFGVVTMGIFGRIWKADVSWFNGREPDENRYNIDMRLPDSYSGRVSFNPISWLSMQASYGFLRSPEQAEPDVSVHKITSSVSCNFQPWADSNLASTLMLGANLPTHGKKTVFLLAEAEWDFNLHHTLFSRIEAGAKTGHDLVLSSELKDQTFGVGALSLGYAFRLPAIAKMLLSIGGVGTLNATGSRLVEYYGGPMQLGGMVFAQLRIADMK